MAAVEIFQLVFLVVVVVIGVGGMIKVLSQEDDE